MTKEEAIRRIKAWNLDSDDMEVLSVVIPELRESEDDMIRKFIQNELVCLRALEDKGSERYNELTSAVTYIEKQPTNEEMLRTLRLEYEKGVADTITKYEQKEQKSNIEKLREISTPADEDWFEIEKKWESEDNEDLRSFISVKFASNAKVIDGKRFAVLTWERFKDIALELINRGKEKQNEQKSRLTVKGNGFYKICPRCKSRMIRDDSKVYTSMPPQYGYNCPTCGTMEFDTVMYDNPEMKEQKPTLNEDDDPFFLL